jgi:uncharacterized protein YbaA (DUF1428 family)
MPYIDAIVLPLPTAKLAEYIQLATLTGSVWREHGALDYHECVADDAQVGKLTSFPQSVQLKEDETVIFAWITYPSREVRDAVNAKVMADPRLAHMADPANHIFDGKRMF